MAYGDIVWVELPRVRSGQRSREQAGRRPCVLLEPPGSEATASTVMIIPFTTKLSAARLPFTIRVECTSRNDPSEPSVLLVSQLRAVDRKRIGQTIGALDDEVLQRLKAEMRGMLDL